MIDVWFIHVFSVDKKLLLLGAAAVCVYFISRVLESIVYWRVCKAPPNEN